MAIEIIDKNMMIGRMEYTGNILVNFFQFAPKKLSVPHLPILDVRCCQLPTWEVGSDHANT